MTLALIFLSTMTLASIVAGDVSALPEDEDIQATSASDFFDKIVDTFYRIINAVVDAIIAPFKAMAEVWDNWADELGQWYAPILVCFVIIVIFVMYRMYQQFDDFLDGWT